MSNMKNSITILLTAAVLLAACSGRNESVYSDPQMWSSIPGNCPDSADVFYLVSTNILESFKEDGTESPLAVLNDEEKAALFQEIDFIQRELFPDSLNFFAPYYHQITMKALLGSSQEEYACLLELAGREICDAFDYYIDNMNDGRPFVLAGFSQGAILIEQLLNHMTDEQYSRMVAAYMIGFGLDSTAVASPHIIPARGAYDKGVTVSFNSARDTSSSWDLVQNNARTCINPVSWSTDTAPAVFDYDGDKLTATMDTLKNLIIVDGLDPVKYELQDWEGAPWPKGNYHHFEIHFYNRSLRQNVLDRTRRYCKIQRTDLPKARL